MRKVRDVLRLKAVGLGKRKIAASLGISASAVGGCLRRAREAGVDWPLAEEMTDEALEVSLYPASAALAELAARRPLPDWPTIHRELKRPGVTLQLLWGEHRTAHPDGYGYSRFCELYRAWEGRLSPTMRQTHVAGERMFVDYAGTTIDVIDAATGEVMRQRMTFARETGQHARAAFGRFIKEHAAPVGTIGHRFGQQLAFFELKLGL